MAYCGGLDWGSAEHGICIIEHDSGKIIARFPVAHDAAGIADLMRRLARLARPADLPIAIERPSGLIVDALVAAGHPVVPIHQLNNLLQVCLTALYTSRSLDAVR